MSELAEQNVIGALLIDNQALNEIYNDLKPDMFTNKVLRLVYTEFLKGYKTPKEMTEYFANYYKGEKFIQVIENGNEDLYGGMLAGNTLSGFDGLKIYITGNEERMVISAQFDNLGKGASGAAVQCLNILLGCEEDKGLAL